MNKGKNLIVELTFEFAVEIVLYSTLLEEKKRFIIANQLIKAGTSIGANVREAQNAESRGDFIHKMKVAAKEADECEFWLNLCNVIPGFPASAFLINKCVIISKVLSKIISSNKKLVT